VVRCGQHEAARVHFLASLCAHLDSAGLDHVSEFADGDPPQAPRGTPFQAWSLGERLRIERMLST
jgi:glycogen debranching enzyme